MHLSNRVVVLIGRYLALFFMYIISAVVFPFRTCLEQKAAHSETTSRAVARCYQFRSNYF